MCHKNGLKGIFSNANIMEIESTNPDGTHIKNYKDKEFVREYMRNYMQEKYNVLVTCENCGKQIKRYSMPKHAKSKDCKIAMLENILLNSFNS